MIKYKPYDPYMINEFYNVFSATSGEMNVQNSEIHHRVHQLIMWCTDHKSPFHTAFDGDKMVGYVMLKRDDKGHKKSSAHVAQLRISVHPDYQGQKIGTNLINLALAQAKEQGVIKRIEVLNYETSIDDRHWFEKLGFQVEGRLRKRIYANGKYIDAFSMAYVIEDDVNN